MSDDWGDDNGGGGDDWGNDNNNHEDGGDDWGAINDDGEGGGGGGGGWGDDGGDGVDDQSVDVQISNIFYEGEDLLKENPSLALEKFQSLIELGNKNYSSLNDESKSSLFHSQVHIVKLLFQLNRYDDMLLNYKDLLSSIPKVTKNEGSDAIDSILNLLNTNKKLSMNNTEKFLENMYTITSEVLAKIPDTERMLFNVNMKLCKSYMDKEDYSAAKKLLSSLLKTCQTPDGQDDKKNRGSELLEIYSIEMKMALAKNDNNEMKQLYDKTKDLTAAVKDPRSQSIIRECYGKMFGNSNDWQRAYVEFYSAFTHYQEIGQSERAKMCLKYVIVANMLSGNSQNPFDAREAKVYQNDSEIAVIGKLRTAYEKCDVVSFNDALIIIDASADNFIKTHLESMIRDFQSRSILQKVRSYRRVKISFLAEELKVANDKIINILIQLILDGDIIGRIDQVNGILDLTANQGGGGKKYTALDQWNNALTKLTNTLTHPSLAQHY